MNGVSVAASQLRELGETLIDVHGQHAHQSLLKPAYQLKLLDDHAGTFMELSAVREAFTSGRRPGALLMTRLPTPMRLRKRPKRLAWMIEDLEALSQEAANGSPSMRTTGAFRTALRLPRV